MKPVIAEMQKMAKRAAWMRKAAVWPDAGMGG